MKVILGIGAVVIIGLAAVLLLTPETEEAVVVEEDSVDATEAVTEDVSETASDRAVVSDGTYEVLAAESVVNWAGQKPLIEGYINSGSIAVTSGTIAVAGDEATGSFTLDMNTLSVSGTPAKPGAESALESHLKGERWFDVARFPEASFSITSVTPQADSDTTFVYDVTGELTLKGVTDTLTFPATIYTDEAGLLHAEADFEFDRTIWGVTASSGSFFDGLADNAVADMVALSFSLIAEQQ